MNCLVEQGSEGAILRVHVQPKASCNEVAGLHGDALKIRIQAPPVDGRANAAVAAFLAELFSIPRRDVHLQSGETGRSKRFLLKGVLFPQASAVLERLIAASGKCPRP